MVNGAQQLPSGWEWTTLGKLANYINGRAFKPTDWETTGRPIIRIQNLTRSTSTLNRFSGEVESKYIIRDGDLLISWSATLGAFIYRGEEAVLNQHIFKVEPFVNKKFLFYLVTAYLDTLKRQVHGSGMQHITKGKFDNSPVPLPPPDEQERIVAKIEELFTQLEAGTSALERVQTGLRRYKASVLKAAVEGKLLKDESGRMKDEGELPEGWRWVQISAFLDNKRGAMKTGPFGSLLKKHEHRENGVPVVGIENIKNMEFVSGSKIHITEEKADQLAGYDLQPGDIVISRSGTVGEVAVIPDHLGNARMSTNIMRVCLDKSVMLPKYFTFLFNGSPAVLDQVAELCKGSTRNFLNQHILKSINFPLPPLEEQRRIVAEVERRLSVAREVESVVEKALVRASRLRQAVLKSAFEGKLT